MSIHALILLEGETEEEFYRALANQYLQGIPKTLKNLKGTFNINNRIVDRIIAFSRDNPNQLFDVYICIDQEKDGEPPYNEEYVKEETKAISNFSEVYGFIANIMIESIFFIDIDGIYRFLRTEKSKRKPGKYRQFRQLTHHDLTALFKQNNKIYVKGKKCRNLVSNLDFEKIRNNASEIDFFINCIKRRHNEHN